MAYRRVIPRDLFNEANLLKCYGRLYILLANFRHDAWLSEGDGKPFRVEQDPADGSITLMGLPFRINGNQWRLSRPLNSREPWPLYASRHDVEVSVFTNDGELTQEFLQLIGSVGTGAGPSDEDDHAGPCTSPDGHIWVCRDDDPEVTYCENCLADGNA